MPTIKDILIAGRAKIAKPENWIKGILYADANENQVVEQAAGCKFCSVGALPVYPSEKQEMQNLVNDAYLRLNRVCRRETGFSIVDYNDAQSTTHKQILEIWDKAINEAN